MTQTFYSNAEKTMFLIITEHEGIKQVCEIFNGENCLNVDENDATGSVANISIFEPAGIKKAEIYEKIMDGVLVETSAAATREFIRKYEAMHSQLLNRIDL
jgi:hypothetical protein